MRSSDSTRTFSTAGGGCYECSRAGALPVGAAFWPQVTTSAASKIRRAQCHDRRPLRATPVVMAHPAIWQERRRPRRLRPAHSHGSAGGRCATGGINRKALVVGPRLATLRERERRFRGKIDVRSFHPQTSYPVDVNRCYPRTPLSWLARLDHSHCNSAGS